MPFQTKAEATRQIVPPREFLCGDTKGKTYVRGIRLPLFSDGGKNIAGIGKPPKKPSVTLG
jgi:hypothetical protein